MKVYIYKNCSTCKNALRFLEKNHLKAEIVEITQTPPTLAELQQMLALQSGQLRKLFNTSGQLYRELQLSEKLEGMPLELALKLLNQNGMLVKRPFLLGKGIGLLGFNEKEWQQSVL